MYSFYMLEIFMLWLLFFFLFILKLLLCGMIDVQKSCFADMDLRNYCQDCHKHTCHLQKFFLYFIIIIIIVIIIIICFSGEKNTSHQEDLPS